MKVFSSNPLVKDTADKAFCLAREHFNVPGDEKMFGKTSLICYIEGQKGYVPFLCALVGNALLENGVTSDGMTRKSFSTVERFLNDGKKDVVDFSLSGNDDNLARFAWIAIKVRGFSADMENKVMKFDLLSLVASVVRVFSYHELVKKANESFGLDLKALHVKLKEMLAVAGTFNRISREPAPGGE